MDEMTCSEFLSQYGIYSKADKRKYIKAMLDKNPSPDNYKYKELKKTLIKCWNELY